MLSEKTRAELDATANKAGRTALHLSIPGQDGSIIDLAGPPGLHTLDLLAAPMREIRALVMELGHQGQRDYLLSIARNLSDQGIKARTQGKYDEALCSFRFALAIALHYQEWVGVTAVTANQWFAFESFRDAVRPNVTPPAPDGPPTARLSRLPSIAGNMLYTATKPTPEEELVAYFRHVLAEDASCYGLEIVGWASECLAEPEAKNGRMPGLHRLAAWAGDAPTRARLLAAMVEHCDATQDIDALVACIEDLCRVDPLDITLSVGVPVHYYDDEGGKHQSESPLADVYPAFLRAREGLSDLSEAGKVDKLTGRYRLAFSHLQYMRWQATSGGGTFGHVQSYRCSQMLQPVGRDLAELLLRLGAPVDALAVAEELHARSLVDWMARSHHTDRLVREPRMAGSINAVMPAGPTEIRECAQKLGAPILYFLELQAGYHVWLQRTDGEVVTALADVVPEQIERVIARFQRTPVRDDRGSLAPEGAECPDDDDRPLPELLAELCAGLFPAEIRNALRAEGDRLVVVPDSLLEYLPFCALRMDDGRYLIERFELVFWPSVTVWFLTQTSAGIRRSANGLLREMYRVDRFARSAEDGSLNGASAPVAEPESAALVLGAPDLAHPFVIREMEGERTLRFGPLGGALTEAQRVAGLLGCKPLLATEATRDAFLRQANVISVVHFATHGYLSTSAPGQSFLALADEPLNADSLYFGDRPILIELVVMSACQTALGSQHPDSVIGLTNAFLIAGTNSVVSTLWAIDDLSTVELMVRFYEVLRKGESIAAALRAAQMASLRRDPYYWAAFKITGSASNPFHGRPIE